MNDEDRTRLIAEELYRVDGKRPGEGAPAPKHRKMAQNPYRFLRGSAQIFYADLAAKRLRLPRPFVESVRLTAIMGDCHLSNFGFVTEKGSHGENIIFAPNDFDDACIGHAGWDLARFITSVFLAVEYAQGILEGRYHIEDVESLEGFAAPTIEGARTAASAFLETYRSTCQAIGEDPVTRRRVLSNFPKGHVLRPFLKKARKRAIGGEKFETKSSLGKAVEITMSGVRFRDRPDRYRWLDDNEKKSVYDAFRPYVDDEILDIVGRIGAGTGSVNVKRYYLLVGPTGASTLSELPMCQVVEVKQQRQAAPLAHFPDLDPRNTLAPAHLTVDLQRMMERQPDRLLDEVVWQDAHWLVRSRQHARVSVAPEEICLSQGHGDERLRQYCEACGEAVALCHARSDPRSARFETLIAAAIGQEGKALVETGERYAAQTLEDWSLLSRMIESR